MSGAINRALSEEETYAQGYQSGLKHGVQQERERLKIRCRRDGHIYRSGVPECWNCNPRHGLLADPAPASEGRAD